MDCFLAPSRFVRDKFVEHGWDPAKFEVLPHFQPVRAATERAAENAPLLYFGRLSPEKGVDDLLRAMQRLPNLRLMIAGDGPERGRLEQLAAELGLANVEFAGHLGGAELERAIAGSRFTVLPSHAYETLGKTILESYAGARAVVATDLGSRRELVQAGKTGLLYRTGDVEQLAAAIRFLSSQPELAEQMGRAGWEQVRRGYTPEVHYEVLVGLYERVIDAKKQPAGTLTLRRARKTSLVKLRPRDADAATGKKRLRSAAATRLCSSHEPRSRSMSAGRRFRSVCSAWHSLAGGAWFRSTAGLKPTTKRLGKDWQGWDTR